MSDPISPGLGRALLSVLFGLHYLSALLTIGFAWTGAGAAWRGADRLKRDVVAMAAVNISVTVVLGVAALLFVSVVYTHAFFTSSLLLFAPLMAVVPMVAVAAACIYGVKWLPALEGRARTQAALLAAAGVMAALVAAVFAAISALSWTRPGPGDDWVEMLLRSTWAARYASELALAGVATAAALVVRYGWVDADEEERRFVREAGVAGAAFCVVAAAMAVVLALKLPVRPSRPLVAIAPGLGLFAAFLMAAFGRFRGRGAAMAAGGTLLVLIAGLAALREEIRASLVE